MTVKIRPGETLRICGAATAGPWHTAIAAADCEEPGYDETSAVEDPSGCCVVTQCDENNADLIAHAREALPEYARWVSDAVAALTAAHKIIKDEWGDSILVEEELAAITELLGRVEHE